MSLLTVLSGVYLGKGGLVVLGGMARFLLVIGSENGRNCKTHFWGEVVLGECDLARRVWSSNGHCNGRTVLKNGIMGLWS